jgi:proton-dependent oligopeptide transporter, POT family
LLFRESRGFWLINVVNLGDNVAYFLILALLTRFLGELGLPDSYNGLVVSVYTGMVTLTMLWGGKLSDRLGVKRAITLAMFWTAVGRTLLAAAPWLGTAAALGGLLLSAVGSGISQPALYSGVKSYSHPRAASLGYSLLYATLSLGIGLGSLLSPVVRTHATFPMGLQGLGWGLTGVFWVAALTTWLTLAFHLLFFRFSGPAKTSEQTSTQKAARYDRRFLFFIFILVPVRTLFAHQFLTLPDYVFRAFPTEISDRFEWITGINPPIVLVLVPIFALLTRNVRVVDLMIVGTAVTAFTTFILVGPPTLHLLIIYIIAFSVGEALWGSRFLEYVAEIAPAGQVGAYMGLAGIPWFFAKFSTGLYSGTLLARYLPADGPQAPATLWLIYACIAIVTPIGLVAARSWLIRKPEERTET